ncbi:MAG: hypothetical protein VB934_13930 [Polyangiaceae bacterium]
MLNGVAAESVLADLPPPRAKWESVACRPGVLFWSASIKDLSKTTMMKLA